MPVSSTAEPIVDIEITLIDVPAGRRRLDPTWVETLSDLFSSQGQLSPIELIEQDGRYRLVFGGHRLAAAKLIGWSTIRAVVKDAAAFASEAEITLREITENMARRQLSVLDRSVDIARWREIYEAVNGAVKVGRRKNSAKLALIPAEASEELAAKFAESFSEAAQKAFQLSRRDVFRAMQIATIPSDLRDRIALHAIADNQSELLALAAEPAERQAQIVALLTAEPAQATSVAEAIAIIDRLPKPQRAQAWEKLSDTFSRLKQKDQDRFFELHASAIRRWLANRGGI